jgi:F-type H+-transporting ATPase subunit b
MQIDWLTVAAQAVNFLVLVWLLQRFLYGPITRAMARREQGIKDRLGDAERAKAEAESEAEAYRKRQEELEERRGRVLAEAREAAEEERRSLEREAREEVDARKREWLRQMQGQRDDFLRDVRRRAAEEFFALSRRALGDLGDAELEDRMALGFVRQIEALDQKTAEKMVRQSEESGAVAVRSRFELSADAKRHITRAIHQRLDEAVAVDYEAREDLACGIEMKVGSLTVSWNFASYLDGFEKAVEEQLSGALAAADGRASE